ncbi:partial acetyl-CoA synthetase, partial [uncultured bacterium]
MNNSLIIENQYNIGHICTRQQCDLGRAEKEAMRWVSPTFEIMAYTFKDIEIQSNKFANLLLRLGILPGDVFFTFLPRMPEQFFAFLGILKINAIAAPLFSNFGEEALLDRLGDAHAKGVITKKSLLKKIEKIRDRLPFLEQVIVVDVDEHLSDTVLSYNALMNEASPEYKAELTSAETPSVLHYTSGSTGKPKGVLHVHSSVLLQNTTAAEILTLKGDDIYWCTADQGWVTGTSYGIIGPWSIGLTQVHFGGVYDAEAWLRILETEKITVWYTAPTALRMLMREEPALFAKFSLQSLRHMFS